MESKKTPNPSTLKKKPKKARKSWREEYLSFVSWRQIPVNTEYIQEKAKGFVTWAKCVRSEWHQSTKKFTYERWLEEEGIPYSTMERWKKRDKYVREAIKFGKMILGNNLEEGVITREFAEKYTTTQLHYFLERLRDSDIYQDERTIKVRDKGEVPPTTVIVNMKDYSNAKTKES